MTDKQIIIDGVPVQDCCYFDYENDGYKDSCYIHQNECSAQNCYYKQLKRKEKEYQKLLCDLVFTEAQLKDYTEHYNRQSEELDQLKVENDELKEKVKELRHGWINCDKERNLQEANSEFNQRVINRYKQTLTEIKEILEIHKDNKCAICPKFDECFEHPSCDNIILQKIRECEVK